MDKNTIIGILLMAVVFFGFMWLSPKNNDKKGGSPDGTTKTEQVAANPLGADSLTAQEQLWLRQNIASNGTPVVLADGRNAVRVNEGGVDLTLAGDSLYGNVKVDGKTLDWADVEANDAYKMTLAEQRAAVERV